MDRLDDKNLESFGEAVRRVVLSVPNTTSSNLGTLIENIYLRFQMESERDARDRANGKASD